MTLAPHVPAGSTASGPWDVLLTPEAAGWGYSSLRVADLAPGASIHLATGGDEVVVVPLRGSVSVEVDGDEGLDGGVDGAMTTHALAGRASVFSGPTDVLYLPQASTARLVGGAGGARVAVPGARVDPGSPRLPVWLRRADDIPVELRGAGSCSRQVQNFASADSSTGPGAQYAMHKLIAVEVITPGGNWSSYPPHKHDETSAVESELEEVYYYEVADGPGGEPGIGYHRTYGTPQRPLDVLAEVRSGDTVLVAHGWHGPCMASPGNHLYYLNVMAGPEPDRAWKIVDDADHAWVRASWARQDVDPRLPLTASGGPQ